jgi:hypothetical protein
VPGLPQYGLGETAFRLCGSDWKWFSPKRVTGVGLWQLRRPAWAWVLFDELRPFSLIPLLGYTPASSPARFFRRLVPHKTKECMGAMKCFQHDVASPIFTVVQWMTQINFRCSRRPDHFGHAQQALIGR